MLYYGIIIWRATYPSYLSKLKTLQNKAIRIISGTHFHETVKLIYSTTKILPIEDIYKFEIAKLMYNWNKSKPPISFTDYFLKREQISNRTTRHSNDNSLQIFRYRSNRLQRCIKFQGVKVWNSISISIKTLTINAFKNA